MIVRSPSILRAGVSSSALPASKPSRVSVYCPLEFLKTQPFPSVTLPLKGTAASSPAIATRVRGTCVLEVVSLNREAADIPKRATPAQPTVTSPINMTARTTRPINSFGSFSIVSSFLPHFRQGGLLISHKRLRLCKPLIKPVIKMFHTPVRFYIKPVQHIEAKLLGLLLSFCSQALYPFSQILCKIMPVTDKCLITGKLRNIQPFSDPYLGAFFFPALMDLKKIPETPIFIDTP